MLDLALAAAARALELYELRDLRTTLAVMRSCSALSAPDASVA